jgi:predicted enzyme related to lactoylglutathione lyase
LFTSPTPATVDFYERAFGLKRRFLHESQLYGELDTGETVLAFAGETMADMHGLKIRRNRIGDEAAGFEIALVTDDPRAGFDKAVQAGAIAVSPPLKSPGAGRRLCSGPRRLHRRNLLARLRLKDRGTADPTMESAGSRLP